MGRDYVRFQYTHRERQSFNPRARMGRDAALVVAVAHFFSFNPRARMGRDNDVIVAKSFIIGFNPRARMGRDSQTYFCGVGCI